MKKRVTNHFLLMGSLLSLGLRISEATIRTDAERFSQLHSWNKHLLHRPEAFLIAFARGEQDLVDRDNGDRDGLHMHLFPQSLVDPRNFSSVCLKNYVVLTRELEGYPRHPNNVAERARQDMLKNIVQCALIIAREEGFLVSDAH